jgi:uncharacterized cupin superfamily protein
MSGVTIKRLDEFENNGVFYRARAGLDVTAFGLSVENWPPNAEDYPEHDESRTGQEEVYVVLEGSCVLRAGGEEHTLDRNMFARVGPGIPRKILPGSHGVRLLCIGGVPGGVYEPP